MKSTGIEVLARPHFGDAAFTFTFQRSDQGTSAELFIKRTWFRYRAGLWFDDASVNFDPSRKHADPETLFEKARLPRHAKAPVLKDPRVRA